MRVELQGRTSTGEGRREWGEERGARVQKHPHWRDVFLLALRSPAAGVLSQLALQLRRRRQPVQDSSDSHVSVADRQEERVGNSPLRICLKPVNNNKTNNKDVKKKRSYSLLKRKKKIRQLEPRRPCPASHQLSIVAASLCENR